VREGESLGTGTSRSTRGEKGKSVLTGEKIQSHRRKASRKGKVRLKPWGRNGLFINWRRRWRIGTSDSRTGFENWSPRRFNWGGDQKLQEGRELIQGKKVRASRLPIIE